VAEEGEGRKEMKYVSTRGGAPPTALDDVILNGFAPDGGLYVPESIPKVDLQRLASWRGLHFVDLAFEILSLFIPQELVPAADLRRLLAESYVRLEHAEVTPLVPLRRGGDAAEDTIHHHRTRSAGAGGDPLREGKHPVHILELFHGPTLSFKDVAMAGSGCVSLCTTLIGQLCIVRQ
jgi:threonine synthase